MSESEKTRLVQFKEVADHFGVSVQTVRAWVRDKKIPFIKIGAVYRFRIGEIEESLQGNSQVLSADDYPEEMTEVQIQSCLNRMHGLGLLWYKRPEHRKKIREIIAQRPFKQKIISHLFTGIPIKLSIEEIARLLNLNEFDMKTIIAAQSIILHPEYFPEELHGALLEEYEKFESE